MAMDFEEKMARRIHDKAVRAAAQELDSWLPSEQREYAELIFRILASLPGGDRFEDLGYEPFSFLGWKELDMLTKLLDSIQDRRDVEEVAEYFLRDEEAEED